MTALLIDGQKYDLDNIADASLGDLFTLKVKTKALGYGVSLKTINEMFDRLAVKAKAAAAIDEERAARLKKDKKADVSDLVSWNPMELLDDEEYMANMIGLVYLTRRTSGDDITVTDAWKSRFNSVSFADDEDEDDEVESPAPKGEPVPQSDGNDS